MLISFKPSIWRSLVRKAEIAGKDPVKFLWSRLRAYPFNNVDRFMWLESWDAVNTPVRNGEPLDLDLFTPYDVATSIRNLRESLLNPLHPMSKVPRRALSRSKMVEMMTYILHDAGEA